MQFDPPLNVSFKSLIKDGKFFTLDGEREIKAPFYAKWIKNIGELTPIEVNYILIRHSNINRQLGELSRITATMKD